MTNRLSLQVAGHGDQWERIAEELDAFAEANEWPPDISFTVRLILEELVLNAVDYGTDDSSTEVSLGLLSDSGAVRIELRDNGRPFNPLVETPAPDTGASIEDRKVGGLGVHLVKSMSDDVSYRHADGFNILTVVKRRSE